VTQGSLKKRVNEKSALYILFLVLLCNSALLLAQTEPEEIKLNSDQFRDYFYESLKQKQLKTTISQSWLGMFKNRSG
jgi:hypothetical protein